jgi:hypothetical protein
VPHRGRRVVAVSRMSDARGGVHEEEPERVCPDG